MSKPITYKDSGVDTARAQELVSDIATIRARTEKRRQLYQGFGMFAAGYDLSSYSEPVIFSACDGVGTKIKPLLQYGHLQTAGIDLVAMNVNDILCCNAMPIKFLDYIGTAKIDKEILGGILLGISQACADCDCILAGGETAEMPDLVHHDLVELSGFCVGVAEKSELIDPTLVQPGDVLLGIPSNGFHANGWSLVRKVIAAHPQDFPAEIMEPMLAPTRIYFPEVVAVNNTGATIHGMAHITGGGMQENIERVLNGHGADITLPYWDNTPVQTVIAHLDQAEAIHAFNMGIGYVFVICADEADTIRKALPEAITIGTVTESSDINVTISPKA